MPRQRYGCRLSCGNRLLAQAALHSSPDNIWQPCTSRRFCLNLLSPLGADTARPVAPNPFSREAPPGFSQSPAEPRPAAAGPWHWTLRLLWPASDHRQPQLADGASSYDIMRPQQTFWDLIERSVIWGASQTWLRISNRNVCFCRLQYHRLINIYRRLLPSYLPHFLMDDTESEAILTQFYTIPCL